MDWMIWVWLGVTALSLIIEFVTMEMASIWFVAGGIVCMILASVGVRWEIQLVVFIVLSLVLLLALRKIALKFLLKKDNTKTNAESAFGETYKLLTDITEDNMGTIKINGVVWNVVSADNKPIQKGELVRVLKISGNKYIVEKGDKE